MVDIPLSQDVLDGRAALLEGMADFLQKGAKCFRNQDLIGAYSYLAAVKAGANAIIDLTQAEITILMVTKENTPASLHDLKTQCDMRWQEISKLLGEISNG